MLRKQILSNASAPAAGSRAGAWKDIPAIATVLVTSEDAQHPIDNLFDDRRPPGGSRWIAATPGEQTIILAFDTPQLIHRLAIDIEEPDIGRTQEIAVAVSRDGGHTYRELLRQEYTFSPPATTVESEQWTLGGEGDVSHLRLMIRPNKGGGPARATVTTLAVQ